MTTPGFHDLDPAENLRARIVSHPQFCSQLHHDHVTAQTVRPDHPAPHLKVVYF